MKKKKVLPVIIFLAVLLSIACSSYNNEKQLSIDASEKFYENYNEKNFQAIADNQVYSTLEPERKEKLIEKLKLVKDLLGNINTKELKKEEAELQEDNSVAVSCFYQLKTDSGTHYQKVTWRIKDNNPSLLNVWTFSYNEKGEMQLIVNDGKIIL